MLGNVIIVIRCNKQIHAEKIVGSKLALDYLKRAPNAGELIEWLLWEYGKNGKPRVTNRTQISEKNYKKISFYFIYDTCKCNKHSESIA